MFDHTKIKQLIDKVFFKNILVELPLEAQFFLKGENVNFDLHSNPPSSFLWEGNSVECTVEYRNYDALMDLVNGQYSVTEDMHYGLGINPPTTTTRYLSISDLVELIDNNFWVVLKNPVDFGRIHETITDYLLEINNHTEYNEFYKRPPEEDIVKLQKLKQVIEVIAKPYIDKFSNLGSIKDIFTTHLGKGTGVNLSQIKLDPNNVDLANLLKGFKLASGNSYNVT